MERQNLWAPWRMEYIKGLTTKHKCFLCHYLEHPEDDAENLVLWRTQSCVVVFNRFPYNNGHMLVAPNRHIGDLDEATDEELSGMMRLIRDARQALSGTISPHGFNVGLNLGRCAGAGLPEHLHFHIVPRWDGDTNFMAVCSGTDVISQSLEELYRQMVQFSHENNLPSV